EGQTKTRIQFDSISTAGNRPHIGNEVDYVVFTNKRATVTIKYVNEQGQEIKAPEVMDGYEGETYDYREKISSTSISGYALDTEQMAENIKGKFTDTNQEITVRYKKLDSNIPSQDVDNIKPEETSSYGIAYMPKQFQTNGTVLNDLGAQSIPVNKTNRFDVGVRDLRNTANQWTLKAQLVWENGKELQGSSIKTTNNSGTVMKNINNGVDPFNPETDLTNSNNEVQGGTDVTITNVPTEIMSANNVSHNAVYNYNLGEVSLEIPETRMIQPGTYNGHVEWNLSDTLN
ncbi:MucBP domain-containing protein, partial [Enterococcus hirae]